MKSRTVRAVLAGCLVVAAACGGERTQVERSPACAGLVPAAPGPGPSVRDDVGRIASCKGGITDGTGELVGLASGLHWLDYGLYPSEGGAPVERIRAYHAIPSSALVVPQPRGFHAADWGGAGFAGPFVAYDVRGRELARGTTLGQDALWVADDPLGGSAVLTSTPPLSPDPVLRLERVDDGGKLVATAELERGTIVGVAGSGNALVLASDGSGRWFDRDALPITPWFDAGVAGTLTSTLRRLADGRLALRSRAGWQAVFADGATAASSPPSWLAERPWADAHVVLGGRATALAWDGGDMACRATEVEIFTVAGERCGSVMLPAEACSSVSVGKDGTVIAQLQPPTAPNDCVWQWWPALLR
jgi:hypothetical protein